MGTAEMKSEIRKFVDGQNDPDVLKSIYDILEKASREEATRQLMEARALEAEEDIKAGRIYTSEEFEKQIKDYIYKR